MGPILWREELRFVKTMPGEPSALKVSMRRRLESFADNLAGFLEVCKKERIKPAIVIFLSSSRDVVCSNVLALVLVTQQKY